MAKTCCDRFKKIVEIIKTNAWICGANILDPNFRVTIHTMSVIILINAFIVFSMYTIYVGLVVDGDWKVILQVLSLAGSALQGYSKLLSAIYKKDGFQFMFGKLAHIYMEYETDKDYSKALRYRIDLTTKMLKIVVVIYIICILAITVYPLIYGPLHGQRIHLMQFFLPGIDPTTDTGYWIYVPYHSVCLYLGAFGNFAGDMLVFTPTTHVSLFVDILKIKCEKLNRAILKKTNTKDTMTLLKEIVQFHQEYITFVQHIEETFFFIIFTQVFTSVMSICCTIFSIVIKSWPVAFVYLMYSIIMLFTYCGLGNLVDLANDDITDVVYCDVLWYQLSIPEQKLVLLMLRKSQKPIALTVGHIMPLSMNTAVQLAKAIYSYMMMLVNFLQTDDM